MGNRDINFVTPPTSFEKVLILNPNGAKDADVFSSFAEIENFINSLPDINKPSELNPYSIDWHPSGVIEDVWLPDFVSLDVVGGIGQHLIGGDNFANGIMLSLGVGSTIKQATIVRIAGNVKDYGLFARNSNSLFTVRSDSFDTINANDELKITPQGAGQVTIIFAGGESTALAVTNIINAQGGPNVEALLRGGRVEIRHVTSGNIVTVNGTGAGNTANVALGFSNDSNSAPSSSGLDSRRADNIEVLSLGGPAFNIAGIGVTDRDATFGTSFHNVIVSPGAGSTGIKVSDGANVILANPIVSQGGIGLDLGPNSLADVVNGGLFFNTLDLNTDPTSQLNARGFSYGTRNSGGGEIIPSGARIIFSFDLNGNIATGRFDGIRSIPYKLGIERITLSREIAGTGGTTLVDIFKSTGGGAFTTLYTTPGNRPSISAGDGDRFGLSAIDPDIIVLEKDDILAVEVITKEGGIPQNLNLTIDLVVV